MRKPAPKQRRPKPAKSKANPGHAPTKHELGTTHMESGQGFSGVI